MRLLALGIILVAGAATARKDCDKLFCTPLFFKDLSQGVDNGHGRVTKELIRLEPILWHLQRLADKSVWDIYEYVSHLIAPTGERHDPWAILRAAITNPIPLPMHNDIGEAVEKFFLPSTDGQSDPSMNMVSLVTSFIRSEDTEYIARKAFWNLFKDWKRFGGSETADSVLKATSKYAECLFPQKYSEDVKNTVGGMAEEYVTALRGMEISGNYTLEMLQVVNPTRFQQIQSFLSQFNGGDAADRIEKKTELHVDELQGNDQNRNEGTGGCCKNSTGARIWQISRTRCLHVFNLLPTRRGS